MFLMLHYIYRLNCIRRDRNSTYIKQALYPIIGYIIQRQNGQIYDPLLQNCRSKSYFLHVLPI